MLTLKDFERREYGHDGHCTGFTVRLRRDDGTLLLEVDYNRSLTEDQVWSALAVVRRTQDCDSRVYSVDYWVPANATLELVAGMGLHLIQRFQKAEVERASELDFAIGDAIAGM